MSKWTLTIAKNHIFLETIIFSNQETKLIVPGIIIIRCIPILMDFVGKGEPWIIYSIHNICIRKETMFQSYICMNKGNSSIPANNSTF